MEKSLYTHTCGEDGGDTVEIESSSSEMVVNRDVHKVMRSPRNSSRAFGRELQALYSPVRS